MTKETRPGGGFTTYVYDPMNGRLQTVTDPKLQVATYTYTVDGSVTSVAYSNAAIPAPTVTMTYDSSYPRAATMTDGTGTTAYAYVPAGTQGAGQAASIDGPLTNDTFIYTYDELGRRKTRTLNGVTTTWTYDTLGRMQSLVDPIGTFTFDYDGVSTRLHQLAYPNGQKSTYSYLGNTDDRRLQEIHHQKSDDTTLSRFSYAYDTIGNIKTWTQQYGADVKAYDFTYDAADQLTGAVYRTTDPTPAILKRYGYAYDAAGNRTLARVDDAPTTFTYNNLNQLTSQAGGGTVQFSGTTSEPATVTIAGAPASGAGGTTFSGSVALPAGTSTVAVTARDPSGNTATQSYEVDVPTSTASSTYDANGNLITQGTRTYEWDAANQLVRVLDTGTEIARFVYDGYGRRVEKTTAGTTRRYVYSGSNILEERSSSSGTIRIVQGPGVDWPFASVDGGGAVSYYLADHLGSVVQQTDASAAVTLTRRYDPYGVPLAGASTSGYAFTGREWDAETQLYYYRARFYDPARARFLSEDPIGLAGGGNLYRYVENAPTRLVDPLGLQSLGGAAFELRDWFAKWFPRQKASDRQTQMETVLKIEQYLEIAEVLSVAGAMAISLFEGNIAVATEEGLACTAKGPATVDTALVRFSQDSIRRTLSTGESIDDVVAALRGPGGDELAANFKPIRIFKGADGNLTTLDNRRLLIFSQAGRPVPFVWATAEDIAAATRMGRFSATFDQQGGWFISVRPK